MSGDVLADKPETRTLQGNFGPFKGTVTFFIPTEEMYRRFRASDPRTRAHDDLCESLYTALRVETTGEPHEGRPFSRRLFRRAAIHALFHIYHSDGDA